jgi:hypothetical protein
VRRATITIDDQLEAAVAAYVKRQEIPPLLTSLVQAALREYLARRGVAPPASALRITPAREGSGKADVSVRHDAYFAGK